MFWVTDCTQVDSRREIFLSKHNYVPVQNCFTIEDLEPFDGVEVMVLLIAATKHVDPVFHAAASMAFSCPFHGWQFIPLIF